jgi:aminoglycoside phosphotransferase (APT) family kinase protein
MPHQSTLDPQSILASLGVTDADGVEPITGGSDTAIWRVMWRREVYALRLFRPEQAATCEREVRAMTAASAGGVPVPQVIRTGTWADRPALLLSWIAGKPLAQQLRERPLLGWRLGAAFGRMQAAIHQVPIPADLESTRWIEWAGDEPEIKARLYDLASRRTALIHLDYHPLNVMADGAQISGVLDWANAHIGDPRADFARTYTILRVEPYSPNGDSLSLALMRRLLESAWRTGYVGECGKFDEMALFYAWAGAAMIRDLSPRIGKPGFWHQDHHFDPVRRWRDAWKRRAGIRV